MAETIQRCELKYLITAPQREALEQCILRHMKPDLYGKSCIRNIYYDTPDYRLIRTSLEKPVYKEKIRLRSYGQANQNTEVFLELKKKYNGVVYKRRLGLAHHAAEAYMLHNKPLPEDCQVGRELDAFRSFYGVLEPKAYLSYEREAWWGIEEPELRITLDDQILWRSELLSLLKPTGGTPILLPGQSLMEIKAVGAMPLWLVQELSRLKIYRTTFSKYGKAYVMMKKQTIHGGISYVPFCPIRCG